MSNSATPYGFLENGLIDGAEPTFGLYEGSLGASNSHSIYQGDPAVLSAGLFDVASVTGNTGAAVAGIFESFSWLSISAGMRVRTRAWLGNTADLVATSVVSCKVRMHPFLIIRGKVTGASGNPVVQANVGSGINFSLGAGPGANQVSTFSFDATTINSTLGSLPFKIYGLVQPPASDPTVANNDILATFNLPITP